MEIFLRNYSFSPFLILKPASGLMESGLLELQEKYRYFSFHQSTSRAEQSNHIIPALLAA